MRDTLTTTVRRDAHGIAAAHRRMGDVLSLDGLSIAMARLCI